MEAACFLLSLADSWRACFRPWLLSSSLVVDWLLSLLLFDISPGQALSNPFVLIMMKLILKDFLAFQLQVRPWGRRPIGGCPGGLSSCVDVDGVGERVEGRGGRRRAAALVGCRWKVRQLERSCRRWGCASLPGGADGGVLPPQPLDYSGLGIVEYRRHRDAEEDHEDPSDNETYFPTGGTLLHHVYHIKNNLRYLDDFLGFEIENQSSRDENSFKVVLSGNLSRNRLIKTLYNY